MTRNHITDTIVVLVYNIQLISTPWLACMHAHVTYTEAVWFIGCDVPAVTCNTIMLCLIWAIENPERKVNIFSHTAVWGETAEHNRQSWGGLGLVQSWLTPWEWSLSRRKPPERCRRLLLASQPNSLALCRNSCAYWATQPLAPPSDVVLIRCQPPASVTITFTHCLLKHPTFSSQSRIFGACWMIKCSNFIHPFPDNHSLSPNEGL